MKNAGVTGQEIVEAGMGQSPKTEPLFEPDECFLAEVDPNWTIEELFGRKAVFKLKDVPSFLTLPKSQIIKLAHLIQKQGGSSWLEMGTGCFWRTWMVRMSRFGPYYENLRIKKVNPNWDGNQILSRKGTFLLSEVARKLPFTVNQITYRYKTNPAARQEMGVSRNGWRYVVDMEVFSRWIVKSMKFGG